LTPSRRPRAAPRAPGEDRATPHRTLALFKPWGYVSRFTPEAGHPGLASLVPVRGVYPAGRLDHDSEGLLVLTDDGALAHALTDPAHGHPRTYWVEVERVPDAAALAALERGVWVRGRRTRPARVRRLRRPPALPERPVPVRFRKRVATAWLEIELREGRNRQVRRMTAAAGHPTLRLVRVAVGGLRLLELGLAPGEWRALAPREVAALRRGSEAPGATPGVPAPRAPRGSRRGARGRGSSGARSARRSRGDRPAPPP
jgi:23S rRNA pseudouridine2457 synthase